MLKAVLFDLDGTLLDIDLEPFLRDYFALLGPVVARLLDSADPAIGLAAVVRGTEAMSGVHPGQTNRDVFNSTFIEMTGLDLGVGEAARSIAAFYEEQFPSLQRSHRQRDGAADAVAASRELGLKVALATNPIFPHAAIQERARWAGFDLDDFDFVTSYENSYACKPSPEYFRRVASELGVSPSECMMVGDDAVLDLGSVDAGMRSFYVGPSRDPLLREVAHWVGDLPDVATLIRAMRPDG
ncbi:MAG TPA: HAD family hydrolase [Coriobacteriia bacterium]|nr:HAD family hydrolase [Coriobacteriia bacterium]